LDKGAGDAQWTPDTRFSAMVAADQAFTQALKKQDTPNIVLLKLTMEFLCTEASRDENHHRSVQWMARRIVELAEEFEPWLGQQEKETEEVYGTWVRALVLLGQSQKVRQVLSSATQRHPRSEGLWLQRLRFECSTDPKMDPDELDVLFATAITKTKNTSEAIWSLRAEQALSSAVVELVHKVFR